MDDDTLPDDIDALKQLLRARSAELAQARAEASSTEALIAHLRLAIEKMRRGLYGPSRERTARLIDQMELQLEELEADATEDELAAEKAAASTQVRAFTRRKSGRKPFPAHLPRERVVLPDPVACACCGSHKLAKLGEDVTESWKWCRGSGRWCSTCGRSSLAGIARRLLRSQRRSTCCCAASPARACWR